MGSYATAFPSTKQHDEKDAGAYWLGETGRARFLALVRAELKYDQELDDRDVTRYLVDAVSGRTLERAEADVPDAAKHLASRMNNERALRQRKDMLGKPAPSMCRRDDRAKGELCVPLSKSPHYAQYIASQRMTE